jgi:hypothetical protein
MNTDTQSNANFSILGMPGTSYLYTIDGVNENDNSINLSVAGALGLLLGQNQIQEATVVSTAYSGQFGEAAGGNINYVTKSGGNEFHGNVQYYWNGRVLNANDWFLNAAGKPRPPDIANQWAASWGGPIKKDKLFFFLDTEGLRVLIPQVFFVTIPSPQFEAATRNTCTTSLQTNASCSVDVTFKPTATGTRTAALSIKDSAAASPQTVSLSGAGVAGMCLPVGAECLPGYHCCPGLMCVPASTRAFCE